MDAFSVFRAILSVILSLALILNVVFLAFGLRHKIGTRMCSHLLRSQTAIDSLLMLANLINIQYFAMLPAPGQSLSDSLWVAYCKIVRSEILYWSLVCMSVYNLVCLAVERCCCLCAPMWYRKNQRLLAGVFIAVVATSPFIVEVPYCLLVTVYINNASSSADNQTASAETSSRLKRCELIKGNESVMKGLGSAYVVLFWILPSAASVSLYLLVLRKLRKSKELHKISARDTKRIDKATKKLTLMTCVTSGAFVLLFAMDSIDYLLYCAGVNIPKQGLIDSIDSFLVSINSAVNPMLYLIFMPEFRSFVSCAHLRRQSGLGTDPGISIELGSASINKPGDAGQRFAANAL